MTRHSAETIRIVSPDAEEIRRRLVRLADEHPEYTEHQAVKWVLTEVAFEKQRNREQ